MEGLVPTTIPFRQGSAEWFGIMETMVIIGLLLLTILAGSLYIAFTELRTHPQITKRDLRVTAATAGLVTLFFFWPPFFFYSFPFATTAALLPGLAVFFADDHPAMAGLIPAVLAAVLPLGFWAGWWEQCQCSLIFLVIDPPWSLLTLFVVPNLSIALLSYCAGWGARRLFPGRMGRRD